MLCVYASLNAIRPLAPENAANACLGTAAAAVAAITTRSTPQSRFTSHPHAVTAAEDVHSTPCPMAPQPSRWLVFSGSARCVAVLVMPPESAEAAMSLQSFVSLHPLGLG